MAVIYYFEQKDIDAMLKFLNLMFYINTIIMLIQFFVLGYKQDQLGGIFGVESGCNAYINIFFCVILVINYVGFFQRRVKLGTFLLKALTLLIVSGMAELKFFYIEFIVLILSGFLVLKGYTKKVFICIGGIVIFKIGLHAIRSVFPDIEMGIMQLLEYATNENGYTASGEL